MLRRKHLDLDAMQAAAQLLVGDHDFRNICKMDMANVTNFRRS
jgi:tRNA pseudouridine38/39 synthase